MTTFENEVVQEWHRTCAAAGAAEATSLSALLVLAYSEPSRFYHAFGHIAQGVRILDRLGADALCKVAFFFHDLVYIPAAPGNETASAEAFRSRSHLFPERTADGVRWAQEVPRLVELTARHEVAPGDLRGAQVVAADLWELGSPWEVHSANVARIRKEYARFSDEEWRQGRAAFAHAMLERPFMFPDLAPARAREPRARRNLEHELRQLEGGPPA